MRDYVTYSISFIPTLHPQPTATDTIGLQDMNQISFVAHVFRSNERLFTSEHGAWVAFCKTHASLSPRLFVVRLHPARNQQEGTNLPSRRPLFRRRLPQTSSRHLIIVRPLYGCSTAGQYRHYGSANLPHNANGTAQRIPVQRLKPETVGFSRVRANPEACRQCVEARFSPYPHHRLG